MAEGDYVRLGCRGCGVPVEARLNKDGSRRKNDPQVCGKRCMWRRLHGLTAEGRTCKRCGVVIEHLPLKFSHCSDGCRRAYQRSAHEALARVLPPIAPRMCAHCNVPYTPKHSVAMYCSKLCKHKAWELKRGLDRARRNALKALARSLRGVLVLKVKQEQQAEKVRAAEQLQLAIEERRRAPCEVCRAPVMNRRRFCSDACAKRSPTAKRRKRAYKHRRRAALKATPREAFVDTEIFQRDGWRCQLCGCRTPERLLGTNKPNAPTLDHVQAIANGGAHTRANTQCACRACNSAKRDGPPQGQIGLWQAMGGETLTLGSTVA